MSDAGEIRVRIAVPRLRPEDMPGLLSGIFGGAARGEPVGSKGFLYTFPSSVPGREVSEGLYAPDLSAVAASYGAACERLALAVSGASAAVAGFSAAMQAAVADELRRAQWAALGVDAARAAEIETMGIGPAALGAFRAPSARALRLMHRMGRMPMGARARARRERKKKARR